MVSRSVEASEGVPIQDKWYAEWVQQNVPDLTGKVAVITGANSGCGFWCAMTMASYGARMILACRSTEKAEAAKTEICAAHPAAKVDVMRLDNMDLGSVRSFAEEFNRKYEKLDLLINNAGIMAQGLQTSKDGFDIQLQTNHLAHFLLTALLWPKLLAAPEARVVQHASAAHWVGGFRFDKAKLDYPDGSCLWGPFFCIMPCLGLEVGAWRRYGMTKLCNILFGLELQRRIEAAGLQNKIRVTMCHPGSASTSLQVHAGKAGSGANFLERYTEQNAQSAADGALPLLMACLDPSMMGGMYCGPSLKGENQGPPTVCKTGGCSKDAKMAKELWDFSEQSCKIGFVVK